MILLSETIIFNNESYMQLVIVLFNCLVIVYNIYVVYLHNIWLFV